jgi:hypothetical protein
MNNKGNSALTLVCMVGMAVCVILSQGVGIWEIVFKTVFWSVVVYLAVWWLVARLSPSDPGSEL